MEREGHFVWLIFLGVASAQIIIPRERHGLVYNNGKETANIKLDVFLDLFCPDSKMAFHALRRVADNYGAKALQFRVHMFPLPYHRNAFLASQATFAVDYESSGNKTYDYISQVFQSTEALRSELKDELIQGLGDVVHRIGLQKDTFVEVMSNENPFEYKAVQAWKYGCSRAIHSTPMVLINDVLLPEQRPERLTVQNWTQLLDELLK